MINKHFVIVDASSLIINKTILLSFSMPFSYLMINALSSIIIVTIFNRLYQQNKYNFTVNLLH